MVNIKAEFLKVLKADLKPYLISKEFKLHKATTFIKTINGVEHIIGVIINKKRDGSLRIQLGVRVRFPEVEDIVSLEEDDPYKKGTYGGLIHLIMDSSFKEWVCLRQEDIKKINHDIIYHIDKYGFPFLEMYSEIENVKNKLKSDDPKDWLTYDRQNQTNVLAAILWYQGFYKKSLEILKSYLGDQKDKLPKYYLKSKSLYEYLNSKRQD